MRETSPHHLTQPGRRWRARTPRTLRRVSAVAGAVVLVATLSAAPAFAHNGHGAFNCASTHYVVTRSKSAGDTKHVKTIFGVDHKFTFSNVSPSNPWRSWDGPEWYTGVHGWGVTAQVLESHQIECWQKPI